ncbi:MAG TPA: hypothetical protein QGF02_04555 [Candidatus Babeliales bacterium]|nr:hypothetical protein [Candidatus Babeliales bacterium]
MNIFKRLSRHTNIVMSLITIALFFVILYYPLNKIFFSSDTAPKIQYLTPKKLGSFGGEVPKVAVSLSIKDFPEFSIVNNQFVLEGTISFEFNPELISITTLNKFSFEQGTILSKSEPTTRLIGNNLLVYYDIRVRFNSNMDYHLFPIDDHRLFIVLDNKSVSPNSMQFVSSNDNFILSKSVFTGGWKTISSFVETGYIETSLEKNDDTKNISYPAVVFSIDFIRSGIRPIVIIFIPLLILFILSTFILFWEKEQMASRIIICSAIIGALLTYRFVIEQMSPQVGYFMISDYVFLFVLSVSTGFFIISVLFKRRRLWLSILLVALLDIAFIALWIYLLFYLPLAIGNA